MRNTLLIILFLIICNAVAAQTVAPAIEWAKCYGGTKGDVGYTVGRTANDGFFIGGYAYSTDGDVTDNHAVGYTDNAWLLQTDNTGNISFNKSYGGSNHEGATATRLTKDGGYIITGIASSTDGDVSGFHGGIEDAWVVKLSVGGSIMWQKCLGGTNDDVALDIQQTNDGGYIVAGLTISDDGDVSGNHGGQDAWIVKLDDTGHIQWQKCLGGSGTESTNSILQTEDSGYIITGFASSVDGDVSGLHLNTSGGASQDLWVVRLDKNGLLQWQKCLGGSQSEQGAVIRRANDGNYMIAGNASSTDGDVTGLHPGIANGSDAWVIKMDDTGHVLWNKCYGGSGEEGATDLQQAWGGAM